MTGSQRVKVGLLGAGYIVDAHAKAVLNTEGVSLHAVCDISRGRAAATAAKFGIPNVLSSIKELAATDCDVVHVLLPPANHIEASRAMIEAGKSVFIEKPMGLNGLECGELCVLAQQKGLGVGVNHNFLFTPAYEALRSGLRNGDLGRIDHVAINWHYSLPILKFGPFDGWMLAAPANIMFELGSHIAAFAVDLVGTLEIVSAEVGNPIALPGGQTVYRQWTVQGRAGASTVLLSISISDGQPDRILRVRGRGGSAQLDFGRDIGWRDITMSDNPIFDSYGTAAAASSALMHQAVHDRRRRLLAALRKRPDGNPFEESICRSIRTFYLGGHHLVDPRHSCAFATEVVRLCSAATEKARVGAPSREAVCVTFPQSLKKPTILVVGGTGFIGRRLVRMLVEKNYGVRVLTRNPRAAALEFDGLPVELIAGSHGHVDVATRALEGIETVFHLAKCEGKCWQDYVTGDIEPTRVLGTAAAAARVRRFIYTGTISSYASDSPGDTIDNETPTDPGINRRGYYARSKAACEALLQVLHRDSTLNLVIVRPGIVIGPGSPPAHLGVGRFRSETKVDFWGDGNTFLPLVTVDDVADGLVRSIDAPAVDGKALLLTGPPLLTARDYVQVLAQLMSARIDARPRAAWRNWAEDMVKELAKNAVRHPNRRWPSLHDWRCNSHRAHYDGRMTELALGWKPIRDRETLVARGIADTVEWYLR